MEQLSPFLLQRAFLSDVSVRFSGCDILGMPFRWGIVSVVKLYSYLILACFEGDASSWGLESSCLGDEKLQSSLFSLS